MENSIQNDTPKRGKKKNTIFAVASIAAAVGLGIVSVFASPAMGASVPHPYAIGPGGMRLWVDGNSVRVKLSKVKGSKITIPESIDGLPVTSVDGGSYFYSTDRTVYSKLNTVVFPDTVTDIGGFSDYPLTSIEFPENLQWIYSGTFAGCPLREVTLPAECDMGDKAFMDCSFLEDVYISDGVSSISPHCFENCTSLKEVELPDSVETINASAFAGCTSLESVDLNSVYKIEERAFENCASLKEIVIPETVATIYESAFSGCTALESVTIPESVTAIDRYAFYGCTALETVKIPPSVTRLDRTAFEGCTSLKAVYVSYETEMDEDSLADWYFAVIRY